ncbi:MAG: flagellar basal body L-ring protein FlgH [Desulfobacterales bacterium]|nr:flagellar basal body L-ring protein FlgH [Desulfobacterales bacterium]
MGQSLSKSNSLWHDTASLYEDIKARRLNDLVTINVVESIAGSGKADTAAGRDSTLSAGIDRLFGVPLDLNIKNLYGSGNAFSPTVKGSMKNDFKGTGETTREGSLIGTITAKVVEVMPNNNLVLESRKEITINNEKQILVLRGIIRPDDISIGNTVLSNRVTDAEIYFVGDGILQDKQRQGWLGRILDKIWPF